MDKRKENLQNAHPGDQASFATGEYQGTWVRTQDPSPPYTSNMWVEIETGKVCFHWSYLWKAVQDLEKDKD